MEERLQGDLHFDPTWANDDFCASLSTSDIVVYGDSLFSALSLALLLVLAADPEDVGILADPSPGKADEFAKAAKRAKAT